MLKTAELISRISKVDEFGGVTKGEKTTKVLATQLNFGSREFTEATAIGLRPELKLEIPKGVYTNQTAIKFESKVYEISRTLEKHNKTQIICYRNVVAENE